MEGLTLEVRADISLFERAVSRIPALTETALEGFAGQVATLEGSLLSVAEGFSGLTDLIRDQEALWDQGRQVVGGYGLGLDNLVQSWSRLNSLVGQAVVQVQSLHQALTRLPRRVDIDVFTHQHGQIPKYHHGGPVASGPLAAHAGAYLTSPGAEERDVRVLTGEYILSRLGVATLGLETLRAADRGAAGKGASTHIVENHHHYQSLLRVDGSLVADEAAMDRLVDRIRETLGEQEREVHG